MMDTRNPSRPSKTFSRCYVAPALQAHLGQGGSVEEWLAGRTPLASYARISADNLDGEAIAIGRQHKHNTDNAGTRNCAVVVHYEDNNLTAAKREVKRPAFIQMLKDISRGREGDTGIPLRGCIAVEKKRVYRLPRDFVALQDSLVEVGNGIFIEGKKQLDFVNDDGDIIGGLVTSGTGESEVRDIRERTTRNAVDRALEGKVFGSARRFGWLGASKDPYRLSNEKINEKEWPHLIEMIKKRAKGKSWYSIAEEANALGLRSVRGSHFTPETVRYLVANPAWWGGRILNGTLILDPRTDEPVIGAWEHATVEKEGVGYETWLTIMASVQSKNMHRGMKKTSSQDKSKEPIRTRSYLWSGYTKCGRLNKLDEPCFSGLVGNKSSGKNEKYGDIYRCDDVNCKGIGRRSEPVDEYLTGLLLAYMDKYFSGTEEKIVPWSRAADLSKAVKQRRDIKQSIADGTTEWSDIHDLLKQLNQRIRELESERDEHLKAEARRNLLRGWSHEKWHAMDLAQKRQLIGEVIAAVIVMPLPEGRDKKAPFDPTLLRVSWKKPATEKGRASRGDLQSVGIVPE